MATLSLFSHLGSCLFNGVHDFSTDTITVALTNVVPHRINTILANLTEISYTNCSSRDLVRISSTQQDGRYSLKFTDHVLTASGTVGPFRYIVFYNQTTTKLADPLIGWYDYASSITLTTGDTFTIDFSSSGLFTMDTNYVAP